MGFFFLVKLPMATAAFRIQQTKITTGVTKKGVYNKWTDAKKHYNGRHRVHSQNEKTHKAITSKVTASSAELKTACLR